MPRGRPSAGRLRAMLSGNLRRFDRREAAKAERQAAIAATPTPDWIATPPQGIGADAAEAWHTLATAYSSNELHGMGPLGLQRLAEARGIVAATLRAVVKLPPIHTSQDADRLRRSHMAAVRLFAATERRLLASAAPRSVAPAGSPGSPGSAAPAGSAPPAGSPPDRSGPRAWDASDMLGVFAVLSGRGDPRLPAFRLSPAEIARTVAQRVAAGLPPMARGQGGPQTRQDGR